MLLCLFYRQGNFSLEEAFAQGQIKSPSSKTGSKKLLLQPHRLCELEKKNFFFQGTASPTNICLGKIQERKHGREMDWMCSGPDSNTYQTRNFQTRELQHPQTKGRVGSAPHRPRPEEVWQQQGREECGEGRSTPFPHPAHPPPGSSKCNKSDFEVCRPIIALLSKEL